MVSPTEFDTIHSSDAADPEDVTFPNYVTDIGILRKSWSRKKNDSLSA